MFAANSGKDCHYRGTTLHEEKRDSVESRLLETPRLFRSRYSEFRPLDAPGTY